MAIASKKNLGGPGVPLYVVTASARQVAVTPQSGIALTVNDITYSASQGTGNRNVFDVVVTKQNSSLPNPSSYASATPTKCSVDSNGAASYITDGSCTIRTVTSLGNYNLEYAISATGTAAYTFDSVTSYTASSLRKYLYDQQIAALAGVTSGTTAQAHMAGGVYNPNLFIRRTGVAGFTALPADLLEYVIMYGIFYITPHHYVIAAGHDMSAASAANDWSEPVGWNSRLYYDSSTWTGTLCKIMPDNWVSKLPSPVNLTTAAHGFSIPVWARMYNTYGESTNYWVMPINYTLGNPFPVGDSRRAYQRFQASPETMATGGDSNSPVFCGINGDLVLLPHVAFYSYVGAGTSVYASSMLTPSILNPLLSRTAVAHGDNNSYSVTESDLSGFTSW